MIFVALNHRYELNQQEYAAQQSRVDDIDIGYPIDRSQSQVSASSALKPKLFNQEEEEFFK